MYCNPKTQNTKAEARKEVRDMARDPVCGMEVDERQAAATTEYEGTIYYFCAPGCKKAFEKEPEKYLPNTAEIGGSDGSL